MKKMILWLISVGLSIFAYSCKTPDQEVEQFTITTEKSVDYVIDVAENSEAGKVVHAQVTLLLENAQASVETLYYIADGSDEVVKCKQLSHDGVNYGYEFTMPAANVKLAAKINYGPEEFAITVTKSSDYSITVEEKSQAGKLVPVKVELLNDLPGVKVVALSYIADGSAEPVECELLSKNGINYEYEFTMPAANVKLVAEVAQVYYKVTRKAENATITLYNCVVDQDNPDRREAYNGETVKFDYGFDLGFVKGENSVRVYGENTGEDVTGLWYDDTMDKVGTPPCWKFPMPDEPVIIEVVGEENMIYEGKPFVGEYIGFMIGNGSRIIKGEPTLSMNLKKNTSYLVSSVDGNSPYGKNYDFDGLYTFDESANTFTYDFEAARDVYGKVDFGVNGTRLDNGDTFVIIHDLQKDSPDMTRHYFALQGDCDYVCAACDEWGSYNMLEIVQNGVKRWYYYYAPHNEIVAAVLEFQHGSTIGEESVALVSINGEVTYKYELGTDGIPALTEKGKEAGSYTGSEGDMILDGFGGGTLSDAVFTYTIKGNVLIATMNGQNRKYELDMVAKTYNYTPDEWKGPVHFIVEKEGIGYYNGAQTKCLIQIWFDRNYSGNEEKGMSKVQVQVFDANYFSWKEIIAGTSSYVWDESTGVLTLTKLMAKNHPDNTTSYNKFVLKASEDRQTLVFQDEYLMHYRNAGDYVVVKDLEINSVPW